MNKTTTQHTPEQIEAISTDADNVLLVAGPGSGKTATTVARIERLLALGVNPSEIIAISFTNAAANELSRRLEKILTPAKKLADALNEADPAKTPGLLKHDDAPLRLGFVGTLHSFALRMLKELGANYGYGERTALISPESAEDLVASKAKTLGCKTPMKDLMKLKQAGRPPRGTRVDLAATVVASYFDDLREAGVVDYDVLLTEFRDMLLGVGLAPQEHLTLETELRSRFTALFVDEVQDSSPIDWAIYRALPLHAKFYVGDPDQAVYSFRGGDVREMVKESGDPRTKVIRLEANFRSRSEICDVANRLIGHNRFRIDKVTTSAKGAGGAVKEMPPFEIAGEEIAAVARAIKSLIQASYREDNDSSCEAPDLPSIAVIARTNAVADGFRQTLPGCGIKVVTRSTEPLPPDWRLARALVELLNAPENDALAFFYLIALYEKKGASASDARKAAHAARGAAAAAGKSLNRANLGFGRVSRPASALEALREHGISREAQAVAAERFRDLPPGSTMLDFALTLAEVRERVREEEGDGVVVTTIHGAKGREFDAVFCVGFEEETIPGRVRKVTDDEGRAVEEERRLAYVAMTRARDLLFLSHCRSRVSSWGQVQKLNPSRFLREIEDRNFANDTVSFG